MLKYMLQNDEVEYTQENLKEIQSTINNWNKKFKKIQSNFSFKLPNYIVDEIIDNEDSNDFSNLHYLINCAVINGRITENHGKMIKQAYP